MRERFIAYVVCPKCGQKGAAVWEENEDPVYQRGDWGTTLSASRKASVPLQPEKYSALSVRSKWWWGRTGWASTVEIEGGAVRGPRPDALQATTHIT